MEFKKNVVSTSKTGRGAAFILLFFTLLPRLKITLLPLYFDHFTPKIDNFITIQKGYLQPILFSYVMLCEGLGWLEKLR